MHSTGTDGGHDLHYRTLQAMGVTLSMTACGLADTEAEPEPWYDA